MKAKTIRFAQTGGPEVLRLEEIELAAPGAGEVLVRNTAIGLNYQDIYQRSGLYKFPLPSGVGTEAAGVVEAIGPGVSGLAPGDRICYAGGPLGAYADRRIMPAERVIKTPAAVTDEQAAALMLKGMTVEYLLNRCYAMKPGEFGVMWAAAGGVGLLAGQWAKHLGAKLIGVTSGEEKVALARANGYHEVIDRSRENVVERVKAITGGAMVPVVYDSVGKASFETTLALLAPRGFFVSFGTTTGAPPAVEAGLLQRLGSLYFTRPTLVTYTAKRSELEASAAAMFALVAKGALAARITKRYALADCAAAHRDLEAGRTSGASLLIP